MTDVLAALKIASGYRTVPQPQPATLAITSGYRVVLHPESRTDTIPAPDGVVREVVSRRRAAQKCWQMADGRQVVYCWNKHAPVHYRDDYADEKEPWKEVDPTHYEDMGDHLLFARMPHSVRVWKDKRGYEITDRRTGKVMSAELLEIDDEPVGASKKAGAVAFECDVQHNGVRFWKETAPGGPTKFKWLVKESGVESNLKFREAPEAFDLEKISGEIKDLSKEEKEEALVNVSVVKSPTKDGLIWTEQVDRTGVKIDTDFTGETSDGHIFGSNATYSTARSTSSGCGASDGYLGVGQLIVGGTTFKIYRAFLDFDTSTISGAVTQVNLSLRANYDESGTDFDVQIVKHTWSEALCSNRETNYDGCLAGTADDNIWRNTSGMATNTAYVSGNLDTAHVNADGDTKYSLRSSRDAGGTQNSGAEFIGLDDSTSATAGYRPILVVATTSSPTVTTSACDEITATTVDGNGEVTATGGASATRRGFCYKSGTSGDPTTSDSVEYEDGTFSTGAYSLTIDGLSSGTSYRVRAYAVNTAGTGYGSTVQVATTSSATGLLSGKLIVRSAVAGLLDGKTQVLAAGTTQLDSLVRILSKSAELLDGAARLRSGTSVLFDGRVELKSVIADLLDGKVKSKSVTISSLDGKVIAFTLETVPLDGKVWLSSAAALLLDGKVRLGDTVSVLLDGRAQLGDAAVAPLDGKVWLGDTATVLLDGKARLSDIAVAALDGKTRLSDTVGVLLDGLVELSTAQSEVLDGKAFVRCVVNDVLLLDGAVELSSVEESTEALDGQLLLVRLAENELDGKIELWNGIDLLDGRYDVSGFRKVVRLHSCLRPTASLNSDLE